MIGMSNDPSVLGPVRTTHSISSARKASDALWMAIYTAVPLGVIVKWAMDGRLANAPWLALLPGVFAAALVFATVRMIRGAWTQRVDVHAAGLVVGDKGKTTVLPWDQIGSPTVIVGRSTRRLQLATAKGLFVLTDGLSDFDGLVNTVTSSYRRAG